MRDGLTCPACSGSGRQGIMEALSLSRICPYCDGKGIIKQIPTEDELFGKGQLSTSTVLEVLAPSLKEEWEKGLPREDDISEEFLSRIIGELEHVFPVSFSVGVDGPEIHSLPTRSPHRKARVEFVLFENAVGEIFRSLMIPGKGVGVVKAFKKLVAERDELKSRLKEEIDKNAEVKPLYVAKEDEDPIVSEVNRGRIAEAVKEAVSKVMSPVFSGNDFLRIGFSLKKSGELRKAKICFKNAMEKFAESGDVENSAAYAAISYSELILHEDPIQAGALLEDALHQLKDDVVHTPKVDQARKLLAELKVREDAEEASVASFSSRSVSFGGAFISEGELPLGPAKKRPRSLSSGAVTPIKKTEEAKLSESEVRKGLRESVKEVKNKTDARISAVSKKVIIKNKEKERKEKSEW